MLKQLTVILSIILLVASVTGCEKKKSDAKSMEQLHKENGIPVRVEVVQKKPCLIKHDFYAVLTGIRESTANAMVADKIDKIHYNVGDRVNKDAVVISFPTDNPAAKYFQAKVAYEHSETTLKRMKDLYNSGGISLQDFENTKTQFKVSQANWDAVKQTVKVKAPISGIITSIKVRETDNVRPGDSLFTISQTSKLKATLWIPESQIRDFKVGNRATASWNTSMLDGRVVQVDMALNSKKQAFGVVVEFENSDDQVISGVNAEITVWCGSGKDTIIVARKDIMKIENRHHVFLVADGLAKATEISIGQSLDLDVEVTSGIHPGDLLIIESQHLLSNGSKIQIITNN